jgi:hypothetical protein
MTAAASLRFADHPALQSKALNDLREIVVASDNDGRRGVLAMQLARAAFDAGQRRAASAAWRQLDLSRTAALHDARILLEASAPRPSDTPEAYRVRMMDAIDCLIRASEGGGK